MKISIVFLTLLISSQLCQQLYAQDSHDNDHDHDHEEEHTHEDEHEEHHHDEKSATTIDDHMAEQVGIVTARSGPVSLQQTITSFGRLSLGPEQTGHVRARFPGVIKSVNVTIGDEVKAGDLLALVESNESLKQYDVRAPIPGTIIQRHANVGENTQEQLLFSISNFQSLWAEFRIFPSQQKNLRVGQTVTIYFDEKSYKTSITHLIPAEESAPYILARAKVSAEDNDLFPGLLVEGQVVISEFEVILAVNNSALQTIGDQTGVFIKTGDNYTFTPLILGRADKEFTEVLSGFDSDNEYVVKNSYLIKADIEKSAAEHEH